MIPSGFAQADSERFYELGYWQNETFAQYLRRGAESHPEKIAVTDGARTLTYAELLRESRALAGALLQRGVQRGDVVSVQLPNCTELVVSIWAISELGAVYSPLNPGYRQTEIDNIVGTVGAKAVICIDTLKDFHFPDLFHSDACTSIIARIVVGETPAGWENYTDITSGAPAATTLAPALPDEVTLVGATSGTTGNPKVYVHTVNTQLQEAKRVNKLLGVTGEDVFLAIAPMTHRGALMFGCYTSMVAGAKLVAVKAFEPEAVLDLIERERVSVFMTIPTLILDLLNRYDAKKRDLSSLRRVLMSGAPVTESLVAQLSATWPQCVPITGYGLSETGYTTLTVPEDPQEKLLTSGKPVPGMEVRIIDDAGETLPAGDTGQVQIRGPQNCAGYLNNPEATSAAIATDGWFSTGDLGFLDADGYIHPSGRLKHVIIRGGLKIHAEEVEWLLARHPNVAAACVVPIPHPRLGEKACACVVTNNGEPIDLAELVEHLEQQDVAKFTYPEYVMAFQGFPLNPVGKIDRRAIAHQAQAKFPKEAQP
jgi:non-ribosomal peptide synthetase component E (peptide arylation enzyme)